MSRSSASEETPLLTAVRDLNETTPYGHGVVDALRLLGLVSAEYASPSGQIAALALASLAAHIVDRTRVRFDWNDVDRDGVRGVDILRAFEAARAAAIPNPTPGRSVRVAQAIIKARRGGEDAYLMQYDPQARQYQPPGGKWEARDGSVEVTLRRELAEELGFATPLASEEVELALIEADWGKTAPSATYGILTRYAFDFFHVTALRVPLADDPDTGWISRAEIEAGRADDGRTASRVMVEAVGWDRLGALAVTAIRGNSQKS